MNVWVMFIIGLIVGWLAEWIIDWRFWRREDETKTAVPDLQAELDIANIKIREMEGKLQEALNREPEVIIKEVIKEKDQLEKIHGIGKVFARRFNEAGVFTFADLAALTSERAEEIISPEEWQAIDPKAWIAEAVEFAAKKGAN